MISGPKPLRQQNEYGGHKAVQDNMVLEIQTEMPFRVHLKILK